MSGFEDGFQGDNTIEPQEPTKRDEPKHSKPESYESPVCACCGLKGDLRMGWCWDCADMQSMLLAGEDMWDNDYSDWSKSELLFHIIRRAMRMQERKI